MRSKLGAGAIGGLAAGFVFGLMMTVIAVPGPGGGRISMMAMVASILDSQSLAVGWVYHLFNSMVIGALFGLVFAGLLRGPRTTVFWGLVYGALWWVFGGVGLMPMLLGNPAFTPLTEPDMRSLAVASLVGHLCYGVILALVVRALRMRTVHHQRIAREEIRRAV